jgi:hypothetical protein
MEGGNACPTGPSLHTPSPSCKRGREEFYGGGQGPQVPGPLHCFLKTYSKHFINHLWAYGRFSVKYYLTLYI